MSVVVCDACEADLHVHLAPGPSAPSAIDRERELATWKARTRPLTAYEAWLWATWERAAMRPASMSAGGWLATEPERYIHHPSKRGSEVDVAPGSLCTECHEEIADGVLVMREGKGWRHAICPRRKR